MFTRLPVPAHTNTDAFVSRPYVKISSFHAVFLFCVHSSHFVSSRQTGNLTRCKRLCSSVSLLLLGAHLKCVQLSGKLTKYSLASLGMPCCWSMMKAKSTYVNRVALFLRMTCCRLKTTAYFIFCGRFALLFVHTLTPSMSSIPTTIHFLFFLRCRHNSHLVCV